MPKGNLRTGGVESHLDDIAVAFLITAIIAAAICVFYAFSGPAKTAGQSTVYVVIALAVLGQGFFYWVLFKAAAEALRLLKKVAGLPYAGKLSETKGEGKELICTDCGSPVSVLDKYCIQCGEALEE